MSPVTSAVHPPRSPDRAACATALVVDGNATSRRFVELALERSGSFVVEAAHDVAGALDILRAQPVELVVADSDLDDATGLAFHRRLTQEARLRSIPFFFLTADRRVETKIAALRAGVEDYLVKPCDGAELVARAEAAVARQRRFRDALRSRSYTLAGDFSAITFPDLVGMIEMGRKSGVLSVVSLARVGRVYFENGALVHATYGNLVGEIAFQRIFAEREGHFEFAPGPCPLERDAFTIDESVTGLVMEAARVLDDENASSGRAIDADARPLSESRTAVARTNSRLLPPASAESTLAAQLELALRDPFALGELRAWSPEDLARWTAARAGEAEHFLVLLVARMPEGVSAMLGLAGAPTERLVLDTLGSEKRSLGLSFTLRHERTIDVVLVDAAAPNEIVHALRRAPSIVIVCPPQGDLYALGIAARVGLQELLERCETPAVMGVGNAALDAGLRAMPFFEPRIALKCASGALGEAGDDLRTLLIRGVRLWASSPPCRPTARPAPPRPGVSP